MSGRIGEIQEVSVDKIKPYERNAKIHGEAQVNKIAESIKEFGFLTPCLIDKDYNLIAGHGRVMAVKKLGMDTVPCLFIEGLTEAQRKAYILADNKLGELATWDMDLVLSELDDLVDMDFNIEVTGFDFPEEIEPTEVIEDEYTEDVDSIVKVGDLWQLGEHRLICGDSTDVNVIDALMDGHKADMVFTDPPYGMNLDCSFGGMSYNPKAEYRVKKNYNDVVGDKDDFNPNLITAIFDNFNYCGEVFIFGADYFAELIPQKNDGSWLVWDKRATIQDLEWTTSEFELCWSKKKHHRKILRHTWHGLVGLSSEDTKKRIHPTQKPIAVINDILTEWGGDNDLVVDLFGGSGSTLIACEQLNRKCFMCELDPHYCDVIIQRWENLTGQNAQRIG